MSDFQDRGPASTISNCLPSSPEVTSLGSDLHVESQLEVAKSHFLLQSKVVAQRNWFKRRMLMRGDLFVLHSGSRSRLSKVRKAPGKKRIINRLHQLSISTKDWSLV